MPATAGVIHVDPGPLELDITITTAADASTTTYTTRDGSSAHASPETISSPTDFHVITEGRYRVVSEFESATIDDQIVTVSSYGAGPAVVVPVLDVTELAEATPSGASSTALHYRVSGQTLAAAPESGSWFPDIAAVNDEPTGTLDQSAWDDDWSWAQPSPPLSAKLAKGLYVAIITYGGSGEVLPTDGTTGITFDTLRTLPEFVANQGAVSQVSLSLPTAWVRSSLLVTEDDSLYAFEIDLTDGTNWTPTLDVLLVKVADLPAA